MLIREARREDAASIAALLVACWRATYREFVPTDYLDALDAVSWAERIEDGIRTGPQLTYVCEEAGDVLGFVTIGPCRDDDCDPAVDGEIWGLYVRPENWRQGCGMMLYGRARDVLASQGFRQVRAWVFRDNTIGLRFYSSVGFALDGASKTLQRGRPLKAVRLSKPLGHA